MGNKKKIMFFLSNLNGGGAQRTVVNILNHIDRRGFNPILVLLKYDSKQAYAQLLDKEIPIINLNRRGRFSVLKISEIIKKEKPDILFATLPQVVISVAIAHKIANSNSTLILRETNHRSKKDMSQLNFFLLKWAYNYADKIVALSDGVSNDLINLYNLEASKIVTIYNPVNVKKINDSVNLYNKQENRYTSNKTNKVRLVACGRLVPQKNFVLLIKSLAIVDKHFKDWELDILGEGPELETLKSLADSNNIANKINFCGFVKEPYLRMANSDIFVLSSKWEGFGHVIVESMAAGTPVLATDCPHGPREILKDGKYGWLVKNDDVVDLSRQLLFLLNNENEINRMKSKIFERAMDFESSNIVKLYEDVF